MNAAQPAAGAPDDPPANKAVVPTLHCAPPIPTANGLRPYCPETTIHVSSWFSTVYVVVPEDAEVRVAGTGIVGGFKQDRESPGYPAAG